MKRFCILSVLVFATGLAPAGDSAPRFVAAEPVFARGLATMMNARVRFSATFAVEDGERPVLRLTGSSAYRILLNGRHFGYGPARAGRGQFRLGEWPLAVSSGTNRVEVEVAGYNVNSYAFVDQPAFLQAEVVSGDRVLAATSDCGGFEAHDVPEMVRKVNRYSFQRPFAEAFRLPAPRRPQALEIVRVKGADRLLPRRAERPVFAVRDDFEPVFRSAVRYDAKGARRTDRCIEGVGEKYRGFPKCDLEVNVFDECQRYVRIGQPRPLTSDVTRLSGETAVFRRRGDTTGFVRCHLKVIRPGRVIVSWGELDDGAFDPVRDSTSNAAVWDFSAPGEYDVETFEPYTLMWIAVTAAEGCEVEVSRPAVREYVSPSAAKASFVSSDPELDEIFAAARSTFEQNAVDVFTDCPSRERAGWLCDSFFTARTAHFLTGSTELERLFLENFTAESDFRHLPKGVLPMCYPADHDNGVFIPTWNMWLVLQCEEYLQRGGDATLVKVLLPRLVRFVETMRGYRNSDGLLENLPSWVFVEWSKANDYIRDVNYPVNMLWARTLEAMASLSGDGSYASEAASLKRTIRAQSRNGMFFRDHAVRGKDGLKVCDDVSETCQYYAFFSGTATVETDAALWRLMVEKFGPRRDEAKVFPEVCRSNAFIGNYLRLELLSRESLGQTIFADMREQLGKMARKTGTLWEFDSPQASCCHGFASHAAVFVAKEIAGVAAIDRVRRVVTMKPTVPCVEEFRLEIPVEPDKLMRVVRRRGMKESEVAVPDGWQVVPSDKRNDRGRPGCGAGAGLDPAVRETVSLNGPWNYILDPQDFGANEFYKDLPQDGIRLVQHDFDKAPAMNVPTDWNSVDRMLLYYEGPMWLRRKFEHVAKPGRRVILRFGAVNYAATVWLDGRLLGSHEGGFTPFAFDVTALMTNKTHSLVVRADATRRPEGVPCKTFDWWNYGGITRDVDLLDLPDTYVAEGILQCAKGQTTVLEGCVCLSAARAGVATSVRIPELGVVAEEKTDGNGVARFRIDAKPELWSPENPRLYAVTFEGGGDSFTDRIGFRTIETKGKKILLNGKPVFFKGVCFHDEKLGGGRMNRREDALPQLKLAKELGCNFLRLAHYPHNEATVREAERQGFMLWSEIPVYWNIQWSNEVTYANAERQLADMIRRDANRAGIVVWSIANETPCGHARDRFLSSLAKKTRSLDPARLVSLAMEIGEVTNHICTVSDNLSAHVDIVSFNQYIAWYWASADEAAQFTFEIPYDKPVVVSEFGGGAVCGRHGPKTERWTEEFQAELYRANLAMLSKIDGLSGLTPWILNDFRSPRRPCPGIQDGFNRKGLVSETGEKKLAFDVLRGFYERTNDSRDRKE